MGWRWLAPSIGTEDPRKVMTPLMHPELCLLAGVEGERLLQCTDIARAYQSLVPAVHCTGLRRQARTWAYTAHQCACYPMK